MEEGSGWLVGEVTAEVVRQGDVRVCVGDAKTLCTPLTSLADFFV